MVIWNRISGSFGRSGAALAAAFKDGPIAFTLTALILLGATACAVVLGIKGKVPALLNAVFHILPAVILVVGNLRRGLDDPDRWPRWLVIAGLVIAATVMLTATAFFDLKLGFEEWISAATMAPASLILILTLLPPALLGIAEGLQRVPVAGTFLARWLSAPVLYALLLVACNGTVLFSIGFSPSEIWIPGFFAIATTGMAIGFRNSLFRASQDTLLWRLLPHVPAWLCTSVGLDSLRQQLGFKASPFEWLITISVISLTLILPPVLAARTLRRDPIPALPITGTDRPDSIQSKVAHYVDVNGQSARLVDAVRRSDAGVFGVTGVRGAGKSALTRHVLASLAPQYFTLEVTAPVRHDPGLGFFVSVCKAVCSKTLDALEPIVTGTRVSTGEGLWEKLRNPLLAVFALLAGIAMLALFSSSLPGSNPAMTSKVRGNWIVDPLLGAAKNDDSSPVIAQTERAITDSLLAQIKRIIDDEMAGHGTGAGKPKYLLVPTPVTDSFWLLPTLPDTPVETRLRTYKDSLGSGYPNSFVAFHGYLAWPNIRSMGLPELVESYLLHRTRDHGLWQESIDQFLHDKAVSVPLTYLQPTLRHHLPKPPQPPDKNTTRLPAPDQVGQPVEKNSPKTSPSPELLSQMLFNAFLAADPHLEFDSARLREFNDVLRIYRRALDGELGAGSATTNVDGSTSSHPASLSWNRLFDWSKGPVMVFWSFAGLFLLVLLARPAWQSISRLAHAIVNHRHLDLYAEAIDFLEQLSYQSNQESSAGLSWQGISLGRKRTLAARDLTLPGLTARYTRFLAKLRKTYNGKVVIVIDELDKIHDPEQVKALLIEMKGALFVEGTFYLISISEDAARSFRRRLASGRDIFESTFDDVIEIRQMRVKSALAMLQKLEEKVKPHEQLPHECLEAAALFGGGIPREIIRARRVLFNDLDKTDNATPAWAARTLLHEELEHWEAHLGETNVSGTATIRLRQFAQQAMASLESGEHYAEVWNALGECVVIIDPSGLRNSVGYTTDSASAPSGDEQIKAWRFIQSDLQTVLRLMILTHLSEQIVQPGSQRQTYEKTILRCHRALADKPALAETILKELRGQLYAAEMLTSEIDQTG